MHINFRINNHPYHFLEMNDGSKIFLEPLPSSSLMAMTLPVNIWKIDTFFQRTKIGTFDIDRHVENEILMWFDAIDYLVEKSHITLPILSRDFVISIAKKDEILTFKRYGQSEIAFDIRKPIGIAMDGTLSSTFTLDDYVIYRQLIPLLIHCQDLDRNGTIISRLKVSELMNVTPLIVDGLIDIRDIKKSKALSSQEEGPLIW